MTDDRVARLLALRAAAQDLANPNTTLGREARRLLPVSTGLSPEGVDYALSQCLEHGVSRSALTSLVQRAERARKSHVLLSANVFVATFRAIALGLAQSSNVFVRPSSREPQMARLLHSGSGGAFELVDILDPAQGDHVWAYASDETITTFKRSLPSGVSLHAHGHGLGVAIFRESAELRKADIPVAVDSFCRDVIAFDQRGCLSPRVVLIEGTRPFAESICDLLVDGLFKWEQLVPRGTLSDEEQADVAWHEATFFYLGSCVRAGRGLVYLDPIPERVIVPPVGRSLHVTITHDALRLVEQFQRKITTVGIFNPGPLVGQLHEAIGPRRYVELGQMQKPAFDGPVDLRTGLDPVLL